MSVSLTKSSQDRTLRHGETWGWKKIKKSYQKDRKKDVFISGSQAENWNSRCVARSKCLPLVNLPWRNLEAGSSLCRGLKVPTLHSSSLWDGFVSRAACERTHQWEQAWWPQLRSLTTQHHKATHCTSEGRILQSITKSLHSVLSPAMLPKAHTAWR